MSIRRYETIDENHSSTQGNRLLSLSTHNIFQSVQTPATSMSRGFHCSVELSRKLDLLNIIFERYFDERIGGVREDKVVRLVSAACHSADEAHNLCEKLELNRFLLGQSSEERKYRRMMLKNDNIRVFVWGTFINMFSRERVGFIESMLTTQSIFKSRRQAYRARVREKLNTSSNSKHIPINNIVCHHNQCAHENLSSSTPHHQGEDDVLREMSVTETTANETDKSCIPFIHNQNFNQYNSSDKNKSLSSYKSYSSDLQGEPYITPKHHNRLTLAYSSSSMTECNTYRPLRSNSTNGDTCKMFKKIQKILTKLLPFLRSKGSALDQNI